MAVQLRAFRSLSLCVTALNENGDHQMIKADKKKWTEQKKKT